MFFVSNTEGCEKADTISKNHIGCASVVSKGYKTNTIGSVKMRCLLARLEGTDLLSHKDKSR